MQGVCPQQDLLWDSLTAREHLNFFGCLKGLEGPALTAAVRDMLHTFRLTDMASRQAGCFSGGARACFSSASKLLHQLE
jgi:ABC-type multidrug transport system ATPase subunit